MKEITMECPHCQNEIPLEGEIWQFCCYCAANLHETLLGCTGCGWLIRPADLDRPDLNYCGGCGGKIGEEVEYRLVNADFKVIVV